jgi:hypothetical protein
MTQILTKRELNRALLARQHLLERTRLPAAAMIEHLVGMQAQNPLDPYFALAARIDGFQPAELAALLEDRRAVRTGGIRTTIHLHTADDALALAPFGADIQRRVFRSTAFAPHLDGLPVEEIVAAGRELLDVRPRTNGDLGKALAARWPGRDATSLGYAVRYLLPVVQVPPRGIWGKTKAPTWAALETWLERQAPATGDLDALVLRYLAAFGPASPADARTWSWLTSLRESFVRLRPRLVAFRDEAGRELFDLPDAPRPDPDTPAPVRFLPEYDNLLLAHDDRSRMADRPIFGERMGWKGSILVDGFLAGAWKIRREGKQGTVTVELFDPVTSAMRAEVEAEAERVTAFAATGFGPLDLRIVED